MKLALVLLLAFVAFAAAEKCHPQCKWQCDDPACPAVCHPVCERPKCEMRCEETPCAKCTIHCEKPTCTIRCPKDQCEKDDCPHCETVCKPAQCHVTCSAPEPKCAPVCEELNCGNKCVKPTNCAKPKCELQCEKAACEWKEQTSCCPCNKDSVQTAMTQANSGCQTVEANTCNGASTTSFIETLHTMYHKAQRGEEHCCPCADN